MLAFLSISAKAQPRPSPEQEAFFSKLMGGINTRHVNWVNTTARETNSRNLSETEIRNKVNSYAVLGSMGGQDIEALCFLVMMQAAKSAQEDLKAIMAKVKSINEQKAKLREFLSKMQQQRSATTLQLDSFRLLQKRNATLKSGGDPDTVKLVRTDLRPKPVTKAELDSMVNKLKIELDSMSEMGEMESLRLQMAMDRMSKMMSTLSNILKKISKTADDITQNLK